MVKRFNLIRTPKILFGAGELGKLPGLLQTSGRPVLIITGKKSYQEYRSLVTCFLEMEKMKIPLLFDRVEKEPSPEDIDRIVERFRKADLQAVIAVGGGSVMDTGKAVSAMLPMEGPVVDYLEGIGTRKHPGLKKFFIAVATTAGTGSEATANAVLSGTDRKGGFKRSLRHENLVPDIALVDPVLTVACPDTVTAASGLDAFTQLIESYLSVKAGVLTDALALQGIRMVNQYLPRVWRDGTDLEARSGMSYAALLSGITLSNAGLGLVHGFASSLGGYFPIPHGVICATLLDVVNRFTLETLPQKADTADIRQKINILGEIFSGQVNRPEDWYFRFTADYLEEYVGQFNLPALRTFGVQETDLEKIAMETSHKNHPVHFDTHQLVDMLRRRL